MSLFNRDAGTSPAITAPIGSPTAHQNLPHPHNAARIYRTGEFPRTPPLTGRRNEIYRNVDSSPNSPPMCIAKLSRAQ
ncbi:MAG: hypothetical protein HC888_14385 [Candidatus Competibacteraceae bacterium]|nr:hypothetical protein [Candidatus Competibacteraceae bacterium]